MHTKNLLAGKPQVCVSKGGTFSFPCASTFTLNLLPTTSMVSTARSFLTAMDKPGGSNDACKHSYPQVCQALPLSSTML